VPFEVSTTRGIERAVTVPNSGIETWKSARTSSSSASNSSSARSTSSIRAPAACPADGGQQRPFQQYSSEKIERSISLASWPEVSRALMESSCR
jgi:hypothetical protein